MSKTQYNCDPTFCEDRSYCSESTVWIPTERWYQKTTALFSVRQESREQCSNRCAVHRDQNSTVLTHTTWVISNVLHTVCFLFNFALVPWGLCDTSPHWLTCFFETITNTDIAFHVFLCKAFLTVSHTFARFCVFPSIFYLCLFPLGHKRTPTVPSM